MARNRTVDAFFGVVGFLGAIATVKGMFDAEKARRKAERTERFKREQLARIEEKLDELLRSKIG